MNIGRTQEQIVKRELSDDEQIQIEDAIEKAIDRAYPIFQMYGWTWFTSSVPPTRVAMREALTRLVENLLEDDYKSTGTGRFMVYRHDEEGHTTISITLDLSETTFATSC